MLWYLDSAHQNSWKTLTFSNWYACTHEKLIANKLLQQWQNDGSSNKTTYYFIFDDLPLNQNEKWFGIWIQHIKTVGKHSLSVIPMLACTHEKLISIINKPWDPSTNKETNCLQKHKLHYTVNLLRRSLSSLPHNYRTGQREVIPTSTSN